MAQNSPQSILPENSSISLPERKKSATKRGRNCRKMQSTKCKSQVVSSRSKVNDHALIEKVDATFPSLQRVFL